VRNIFHYRAKLHTNTELLLSKIEKNYKRITFGCHKYWQIRQLYHHKLHCHC